MSPDLSYLSADPAMTGMPANLAAAAQSNLAQGQVQSTLVNDAGARTAAPALPTDVAPTSAAPTAPAEQVPDTSFLTNRIAALQNGLANGTNPDKPAIYVDARTRANMLNELHQHMGDLHDATMEQAHQAHEILQNQLHAQSAGEVTKLFGALTNLPGIPGDDNYGAALHGAIVSHLPGINTTAGASAVKLLVAEHDKAVAQRQAAASSQPPVVPAGSVATLEHIGPKGSSYTVKPVGPNVAANQPADEFASADLAQQAFPNANIERNPTTGGFYPKKVDATDSGAKPNASALRDLAKLNAQLADKQSFLDSETEPDAKASLQKDIKSIGAQIQAFHDTYSPKTATQFDTEEAARSSGHKAGDIVTLKNPKTGKYQKARLE